jgi:AcrR family transcriptional regulator
MPLPAALKTKLQIAEAFVQLVEELGLERVFVSNIVERLGKNRKTFYYHFEDKQELIIWLFRYELGCALQERYDNDLLVFEHYDKLDGRSYQAYPYYTCIKNSAHTLDSSGFFEVLCRTFEARRGYYQAVLAEDDIYSLRAYLGRLYTPALTADIRFMLGNRSLGADYVRFLAEFYTGAFISYIASAIQGERDLDIFSSAGPFTNIIHSSLATEIDEQQLKRLL